MIIKTKSAKSGAGFTLIEVVVVMGIFSILSAMGYLVTIDFYRSYAFNAERDTIVSILQKARSMSLANICLGAGCSSGQIHGVHFSPGQYIIFQDLAYNSSPALNQVIAGDSTVASSGLTDVTFDQLSGDAHFFPSPSLILTDGKRTAVISVNNAGQINW